MSWEAALTRRQFLGALGAAGAALLYPSGLFASEGRAAADTSAVWQVGVIAPIRSGPAQRDRQVTDVVAAAAQNAVDLATDALGRRAQQDGRTFKVLRASAPTVEASVRAAERLIALEGVFALIGGFSAAEAQALAQVAAAHKILFFNVAASADSLRNAACNPYSFHVEASAAMYLDALAQWALSKGRSRWFIVYEGTTEGQAQFARARQALAAQRGTLVGQAQVAPGQPAFFDELMQVQQADPDLVLLLIGPVEQLTFAGQGDALRLRAVVTGFPYAAAQTRNYFAALVDNAPHTEAWRALLWETALPDSPLNARYTGRWGAPLDPTGWAVYAAAQMLYEAAHAVGDVAADRLIAHLEAPTTFFDVGKGPGTSFRPWDHQLRQPIYIDRVATEAKLGIDVVSKLALAQLLGQVPKLGNVANAQAAAALDELGDRQPAGSC